MGKHIEWKIVIIHQHIIEDSGFFLQDYKMVFSSKNVHSLLWTLNGTQEEYRMTVKVDGIKRGKSSKDNLWWGPCPFLRIWSTKNYLRKKRI